MLGTTQPTAYDLNFALGRTRVSVHVSFWIFTAILGWNWISAGFAYLLIWIACVFVSILLHEFGHIWAGHLFGSEGDILLYSFGGLAIGASDQRQRWQRVVVSFAGPVVQLVFYGVLVGLRNYVIQDRIRAWPEHLYMTWVMLELINLYWPLFNLLPVWPLDGGKITREFCEWLSPRDGTRISLGLSIATAAFLAVNTVLAMNKQPHVPYVHGYGMYTVLLFALLAVESYQLLHLYRKPWDDDRQPWER